MIAEDVSRATPVARTRRTESERLIVRHCGNAHPHMCDYFVRSHGFADLCRLREDSGSKGKLAHFRDIVGDMFYALAHFRQIRRAREIIAIGPMACNIALFLKLGLLPNCRRMYWFGLFIHSPKWLRILRPAFKFLDGAKILYVLFSQFERRLYAESLQLSDDRMFYVPYGNLVDTEPEESKGPLLKGLREGEFFFSGGYSNRDYLSLIDAFRGLPHELVIVCSVLNTEITDSMLPPNVRVLRELPSAEFDVYVKAAKACIIPIAHDTGAAGQSCLLRYMKQRKIIIATNTGIIREYIQDGVSGILVKDNRSAMSEMIQAVAANTGKYLPYADAACERHKNHFSGKAIARRLDEMIASTK